MAREIAEVPEIVARLLEKQSARIRDIALQVRSINPSVVITAARGSSGHAAAYFKYCTEILLGVPVASIGPSIASVYHAPLKLSSSVVLAISQSGQGPDILSLTQAAQLGGARAIAIVNDATSPLGEASDCTLPMEAGIERSVAATKSFITSLVYTSALLAEWSEDTSLKNALAALPDQLHKALLIDWSPAIDSLKDASSLYVLARGPMFPIAGEAALKFKETASLHAEAYSAAEVMHGPLSLLRDRFPVLLFSPDDASSPTTQKVLEALQRTGAAVLCVDGTGRNTGRLRYAATEHTITEPISLITTFYRFVETLSRARGCDPDNPQNLRKVTMTV